LYVVALCVPPLFVTPIRSARELGAGYANTRPRATDLATSTSVLSATIARLVQIAMFMLVLAPILLAGAQMLSVLALC
jgi:hypothetical protein